MDDLIKYLVCLVLGYLLARQMGNGFRVGGVIMCDPNLANQLCPGNIKCPQCGDDACPCPATGYSISGAKNANPNLSSGLDLNGLYVATTRICNGQPVYQKDEKLIMYMLAIGPELGWRVGLYTNKCNLTSGEDEKLNYIWSTIKVGQEWPADWNKMLPDEIPDWFEIDSKDQNIRGNIKVIKNN